MLQDKPTSFLWSPKSPWLDRPLLVFVSFPIVQSFSGSSCFEPALSLRKLFLLLTPELLETEAGALVLTSVSLYEIQRLVQILCC